MILELFRAARIGVAGVAQCVLFAGTVSAAPVAVTDVGGSSVPSFSPPKDAAPPSEGKEKATLDYEDHGLLFRTTDGRFSAHMQHRLQFRYALPFDADPRSFEDLDETSSSFMVRRARFKLKGHAFWPWLEWYLQYDWSQPVLRDFSLTVSKVKWFRVMVGRRKVFWNDERVTSSGKQQFVNRSIVNDIFTIDRQQGIQVFGRVLPGTAADFTYYAGVFSGRGVGERTNDDANMMYAGRLQWNMFGRELDFSQSDVEGEAKPVASLAFGASTNISGCTAYETDRQSCRALPTPASDGTSFAEPTEASGRYKLEQGFGEFRLKWRGLYAKHEYHVKRVIDRDVMQGQAGRTTLMRGSLSQLGYFPHHLIPFVPKPLELAARYAFVDPARKVARNLQTEISGVINWFFAGHDNKLSLEASRLTVAEPIAVDAQSQWRVRAQWDVSF